MPIEDFQMVEPLTEDAKILFSLIKSHSGIEGKYIILQTGFPQDRCIDALKELVLKELIYFRFDSDIDYLNPRFQKCRFFPKA
jgi:hypothetical protein